METAYNIKGGILDFEKLFDMVMKDPGMEVLEKDISGKEKFIKYRLKHNGNGEDVKIIRYKG
ncbi:MAG: hypothetical protein NTY20_06010 [Candidatus Aenigmarchaeota archaeon]|nr:hypothetical protein [Candidatus Aenigmarchaeota archaeon]